MKDPTLLSGTSRDLGTSRPDILIVGSGQPGGRWPWLSEINATIVRRRWAAGVNNIATSLPNLILIDADGTDAVALAMSLRQEITRRGHWVPIVAVGPLADERLADLLIAGVDDVLAPDLPILLCVHALGNYLRWEEAERRARFLSLHDPSTRAANEAAFAVWLAGAVERFQSTRRPFGVIGIDFQLPATVRYAERIEWTERIGLWLANWAAPADRLARIGRNGFRILTEASVDLGLRCDQLDRSLSALNRSAAWFTSNQPRWEIGFRGAPGDLERNEAVFEVLEPGLGRTDRRKKDAPAAQRRAA